MKTVYIATYYRLGETENLVAFSNRADAEEYILSLYTEVEWVMFNAMLRDMPIEEAMREYKYYLRASHYTIEECVYQD